MAATDIALDLRELPFSLRGSWLDLSPVIGTHQTAADVHLVSHVTGMHPVLRLVPEAGDDVRVTASASRVAWTGGNGRVEAVFESTSALRFRGSGLGMRFAASDELTPFTGGYLFTDPVDGAIVLTSYETGRRYRFTVLSGRAEVVGDGELGAADREVVFTASDWEVRVSETETAQATPVPALGFDDLVELRRGEFARYAEAVAGPGAAPTAVKAAYVLWSATVEPAGFVGREAVLMSKHWMDKVWSWDHCFNALALAPLDTGAALDQFLLPFDHQDASGALPDSMTHSEVLYNFVKPPIHGWAFARLRERLASPLDPDALRTVYARLAVWTRFWLDSRRAPGHALPYYQHGNDSGWDNATLFDRARVVESPDLAAFLILQLDALAALARELGESPDEWDDDRIVVERALYDQLWTVDGFVARGVSDGEPSTATSLLASLPIVLGEWLPADIADRLATSIEHRLTEWGPATEPPDSPLYEPDGYWRGPVWAPSTYLIVDGLRRAGRSALADRVARAFLAACERSGFAENFDALTGEGLRDRAYTWTAAVYLLLASGDRPSGER
ncbi:glycogen debranching protein [Leifsonia xyli]|uniref:amylo-alpha-1,6-glucosidase n=1 Tax=Leifsonia xyli TaxID=1575 RepID=UPI0007CDAC6A|nr:glycogen debranching protein [Leifsonia xyli]